MIGGILRTFILFSVMFASLQGASGNISIEQLYKKELQAKYQGLQTLKNKAAKRKKAMIISGVLAVITFFVFAYFFKLLGVIVSLIMIAAGFWVLSPKINEVDSYKEHFKKEILSVVMQNAAGYHYLPEKLSQALVEKSKLFAAPVKAFSSWDMYGKKGVKFSFVHIVFDTKENASVERMARNIFDGYIIMIDKKSDTEGVLVSEVLRDEVADMDLPMGSFFAKGKRRGSRNGFDIYGDISAEAIDKITPLRNQKIAVSFTKEKIFIALYRPKNAFDISILGDFDLAQAQSYDRATREIETLVHTIL